MEVCYVGHRHTTSFSLRIDHCLYFSYLTIKSFPFGQSGTSSPLSEVNTKRVPEISASIHNLLKSSFTEIYKQGYRDNTRHALITNAVSYAN